MSYSVHNFITGQTIEAAPINEMDEQIQINEGNIAAKANSNNPVFTGSISLGRKANSTLGNNSVAEGNDATASGMYSHAEGNSPTASGNMSHAEGFQTIASGGNSHSEGDKTTASGGNSHAEGFMTVASATASHAEGGHTTASGMYSHAEGEYTVAKNKDQHVFGSHNIEDPSAAGGINEKGVYIEIVGNGTSQNDKSNARTLDWLGNETLAGDLVVNKGTQNEISVSDLKSQLDTFSSNIVTEIAQEKSNTYDNNVPSARAVWEYVYGKAYEPRVLEEVLADITGVTRVKVRSNADVQAFDDIPGCSIAPVVEGGDAADIAEAILPYIPVGYTTSGTTSETVVDAGGNSHTVSFSRPVMVWFSCIITINVPQGFDENTYTAAIRQAIETYADDELDIGETLDLEAIRGKIRGALGSAASTTTISDLTVSGSFGTDMRENQEIPWNKRFGLSGSAESSIEVNYTTSIPETATPMEVQSIILKYEEENM